MNSPIRALAKAVTYRVTGTAITAASVWIVTGQMALSASVGLLDITIKIFGYYLHERCWERLDFGRPQSTDHVARHDSVRHARPASPAHYVTRSQLSTL